MAHVRMNRCLRLQKKQGSQSAEADPMTRTKGISEHIQSAGLQTFLTREEFEPAQRWVSMVSAGLWCGAITQGSVETCKEGVGKSTWADNSKNSAVMYWLEEPTEIEHMALDSGALSAVFVRIPTDDIELILGEGGDALVSSCHGFRRLKSDSEIASSLAWQMLGCSFTGAARRLFLTGKALELVSLFLRNEADQHERGLRPDNDHGRSPREIEQLYEAHDILRRNLETPPTVPELARMVGLNTRKLGKGFQDLFGNTVYGFIKTQRLEQAHMMLGAGDATVAEVAYACGYQPAHFSTVFRSHFGVAPSELTARRKKQN